LALYARGLSFVKGVQGLGAMADDGPALTRRKFLESAALGVATIGVGCGSEESSASANTTDGAAGADAGIGGSAGAGGSAGTAAGGSSGSAAGGVGGQTGSAGNDGGATVSDSGMSDTSSDTSSPPLGPTVAIVKVSSVDAAVARAVELAGGLNEIQAGQTVFIKPNMVSDRQIGTGGIRTSPEVLAAVVRLVKLRRPGRITVGDRSARGFPDTAGIFEVSGMAAAAMAAGADEIFAARSPTEAPEEWTLLQPPHYQDTWSRPGGILAMRRILEADHLINVPACKNHRLAVFTLAMKNFMGAIGDDSRVFVHANSDFPAIGRDIAILNQMFKPLINVIDATTALINGGPQGDRPDAVRTTPGLIFASKDRVAVDAAAVSLLKLEISRSQIPLSIQDGAHSTLRTWAVWQMPQIRSGAELGLGAPRASDVTLRFENVADAAAIETLFRESRD
jgi:uncharacterized protein (DUF362 family)